MDPNTTISERVIKPYAKHFDVYVFPDDPRPSTEAPRRIGTSIGLTDLPSYDEKRRGRWWRTSSIDF